MRAFHVRLSDDADRSGVVVRETSFEAAAIAFLEREAPTEGETAVVIVCDDETGHERCFRIDLSTGAAGPC